MRIIPRSVLALACALATVASDVRNVQGAARHGQAAGEGLAKRLDGLCAEWDRPDSPGLSIAVSRNGTVLYEHAVGSANLELGVPMTADSIFQTASVSKQFTAMSILLLEQRDRLAIDDDVRKYLPEFPDHGAPLTIRHLLSHTAGLRDVHMLHQGLAAPAEDSGSWNDILVRRLAAQRGLNFSPGTDFQYNNGGYILLGTIVKRVSGMSLQEFADANIFKPLGMTHTRFDDDPLRLVARRVTGYTRAGDNWRRAREDAHPDSVGNSGILSTTDDLLRWERNFIDGTVGGKALLAKMATPAVLQGGVAMPYGLGVWVMDDRGLKTVQHGGNAPGFSAQTLYYPEPGLAIVVLANFGGFDAPGFARKIADICLGDALPSASEPAVPRVPVTAQALDAKSGVYRQAGTGLFMRLFVRDGALRWSRGIGTRGSLEMISLGDDRFLIPGVVPLSFEFWSEGGRHQCRTTSPAQAPATFERVEPFSPSSEQLRECAGRYASAELGTEYTVTPREAGLFVAVPGRAGFALEPYGRDIFQTSGGEAFRFDRDAGGKMVGFTFTSNGVWSLSFHRAGP